MVKKQYINIIKSTDKRINLTSELVQGILAVKTFCWEEPIEENVKKLRSTEHHYLKKSYMLKSFNSVMSSAFVPFMAFLTFSYLWAQKKEFDLPTAIYVLSLIALPKTEVFIGLSLGHYLINRLLYIYE